MTIDRTKEWIFDGMRLGYREITSPWSGNKAWATVALDTNKVIAMEEKIPMGDGTFTTAAASVLPFNFIAIER